MEQSGKLSDGVETAWSNNRVRVTHAIKPRYKPNSPLLLRPNNGAARRGLCYGSAREGKLRWASSATNAETKAIVNESRRFFAPKSLFQGYQSLVVHNLASHWVQAAFRRVASINMMQLPTMHVDILRRTPDRLHQRRRIVLEQGIWPCKLLS